MDSILDKIVGLNGFLLGLSAFVVIGLFHPIVIKLEYSFGKRIWWILLVLGFALIGLSVLFNDIISITLGIVGAGLLWSSLEIRWQHYRVIKGQAKKNPKRTY